MRFGLLAFALPLAASAAAVDVSAKELASPGPPQIRKDAVRKYFKFGPYNLRAKSSTGASMGGMGGMMGGGDTQTFMAMPRGSQFCGDCTVLSGQIVLRFMDGSIANASSGVYSHHILTTGPRKSNSNFVSSCSLDGGNGFVGNGDDNSNEPVLYTSKDNSIETGYWVSPSDMFSAQFVLVNYNNVPKQVEVYYDLEYLPGHVGKNVISTLISASCLGIKTSKTSVANTTSSPMRFKQAGYIVLARGHLHDGGVAMHLEVNRAVGGKYQCSSRAIYGGKLAVGGGEGHGHSDTIANMENCNPKPIKVAVGDTMVMTSEYNLAAHDLRTSNDMVMGMFRIIFAPI